MSSLPTGEEGVLFAALDGQLIDRTDAGYVLHDWQPHNPWAADAEEREWAEVEWQAGAAGSRMRAWERTTLGKSWEYCFMSKVIDALLMMLGAGYQPYQGHIEPDIYMKLKCQDPESSRWFVREFNFICLGCSRSCSATNPEGFQLTLPVSLRKRSKSCFANLPLVSADQLLQTKLLLRVDEAAFVLNISEREIRNYVDEGKLTAHPDAPLRVTVDSVRQCLRGRAA